MKTIRTALLTALLFGIFTSSSCRTIRPNNEVARLKAALSSVCMKQMQEIAGAMLEYHQKNGNLPEKPSDLKGYIKGRAYDNGRISYLIFISPADNVQFDYNADPWAFVDEHSSYIFHSDANMKNCLSVLLSEKKDLLWHGKKAYVAVGGHAFITDEVGLKNYLKAGKL